MCKIYLDRKDHKPPFFKEGEIWWCYMGENIGCEISGKNIHFDRPIFILKKLDKYSFIGLPVTSVQKNGSWYFSFKMNYSNNIIILSQPKHMDYRRLDKKIIALSGNEVYQITSSFLAIFSNINTSPTFLGVGGRGKSQI